MSTSSGRRWVVIACLLVFPITAIAHHLVFYPQMCMLNPFGPAYDMATVATWLRYDWSPYLGVALAALAYLVGRVFEGVRVWSLAFVLATAPLSLWLWDLPIGQRPICNLAHDDRIFLSARHLYLFALVACPIVAVRLRRFR